MSRFNQENAFQEDALSDTLGAILLISVVVMAVTLAGVAIISQPHPQKIPAINADITTIGRSILIIHNGGDSLLRSEAMIVVDGSDLTSSFRKTDGTPWSSWVIGDSLVYTVPPGQPMPRGVTIFYIGGSSAYIIQSVGVPQAVIMSGMSPSVSPTPAPSLPVTAGFSGTPVAGNVPLTVQFTDQSTGPVTSWSWSFGDGGTSTAKNPAYTYPNAGLFTVQLTVSNGTATDTMTKTGYISAVSYVPGLLANYYSDQSWTVPAATNIATRIHFADTASGYASDVSSWPVGYIGKDDSFSVKFDGFIKIDTADDYTFYLTSDDGSFMDLNGTSFINNGGDHSPTTVTATKHLTPGYYPVSVRMYENAGGAVAYLEYSSPNITRQVVTPLYHILATPPVPGFTATPSGGPAPLAVQFTDTSTNGPTAWTWDFGDGTPVSNLQNPAHTYTANGNYNVSLVATNGFGSNTLTKTGYIVVASYSPGILANYYSDQSWTVPAATNVATRIHFADTASGYASDVSSWPVGYIGKDDHFSVKFDGYIRIDTADDYTFYLTSDDGSFMDLDGVQVINNGGDHGPATVSATVHLTPGYHPISVKMYENAGGAVVHLEYSTPSVSRQIVTSLYHIPTIPPTPDFSATPRAGTTPLAVQFTDLSIDATSWSWDFGDGSPLSTTQNPAHTYAANGDYNVSLVATNSYGSNTAIKNNYITGRSFVSGLNATYYLGQNWLTPAGSRTDNEIRFADAEGVAIGEVTDEVNWPNSMTGRQDDFSVEWDGYLRVTTADTYTFSLRSDDGSQFWIDEGMLIDNSGLHSPRTYTGTVALIPGYHHIVVRMFENTGQAVALLQYSSPSMPLQPVTDVWHTPVTPVTPAPVAGFTGTPISGPVPLTVVFADSSTNAPTSWSWVFGDGGTSTVQNPSHQYTTAGTYSVGLTATNAGGSNTLTRSNYITAFAAPVTAGFTGTPTSGIKPLAVQFMDASTGPVTSWSWTFGDGNTSTAQSPLYTYPDAGTYSVGLTVSNGTGSNTLTRTNYIVVTTLPPVAGFTGTPTSGPASLTVGFTDSSTNTPTSWSWSFGDGSPVSTTQNPTHIYSSAGTYSVSLTATNAGGSNTLTRANYITVNLPLIASFTWNENGNSGNVDFTDTSTGGPTSWLWNFGDGGTSTVQNSPKHKYASTGSFNVTLDITRSLDGARNSVFQWITVI